MAALLAACTSLQTAPAATETHIPTGTFTRTPSPSPTPTITFTPSPTPDPEQQPPGYRLVTPEFSYQFLDPPASHSEKQAVVYWNGDFWEQEGYLEYLTLDGERGQLFYLDMAEKRISVDVSLDNGEHSIVLEVFDSERLQEKIYIFNLLDRSVLGFTYDAKAAHCRSSAYGDYREEYIVLGCMVLVQEGFESYYYLIPRSNPERVIRGQEGNLYSGSLYWQGDRLLSRGSNGTYCIFDILPGQPICKLFEEYWVEGLPSPDGKWLEVRRGWYQIGLIPFSCVEDPTAECGEPHWLPIQSISSNWVWDCKAIDNSGMWTPDSQQLLFLVNEPQGVEGDDPHRDCKGVWTGQELWRYDLPSGKLEMVRKYEVGDEYSLLAPLIWVPDGKHFVAYSIRYPDNIYSDIEVYLVSSEDGEMTLISEIPSSRKPLGVVQLP